jgi:hypothetical protein
LRGTGRHSRRTRLLVTATGFALVAAGLLLASCGESSSDANEPAGTYPIAVTEASFPTAQRLGQTSLLQLGFRNSGEDTVPALSVTITIAGEQGAASSLPFGVHDPTPGLAQAERPVWVLAETYPRLVGSSQPGGASTSNRKTFDFGPLKPGETTVAVWKLSAVRAGEYTLLYSVDAGLSGEAKAVTESGKDNAPGGSFVIEISRELPETEVKDNGEVVEIGSGPKQGGE